MKTMSKPVMQSSSSALAPAVPKFDAGKACLMEVPKVGRQEPESDRDTAADSDESPHGIDGEGRDGQYIDPESGLILHTAADGFTSIHGTTRRLSPDSSKRGTLMVWDWDDTLFPSTWINCQGLRLEDDDEPPLETRRQLTALAREVERTLRLALSIGQVVIVTNAETGWVELSCRKFFPSLQPLVKTLRVVSARSTYEEPGFFSPLDWKIQAFAHEIRTFWPDNNDVVNIMSLGDSIHEREALIRSCETLPETTRRTKSVKFPERPEATAMLRTHSNLQKYLKSVVEHDGDLDLAAASSHLAFFGLR
jgi:hypothetical protein